MLLYQILNTKDSLTCGIVIDRYFKPLPGNIESKFSLNVTRVNYRLAGDKKTKYLRHYKMNSMSGFDPLLLFKEPNKIGRT